MPNITVVDRNNKKTGVVELSDKIFDGKVNEFLLQQAVTMYLANQRKSFAKVKDRAEVRGGGKKPWRQKGTGRARVGSIRSPLWRGGGVTFGPAPKDWHYQIPKKMKNLALISSINAKIKEGSVIVINDLDLASHKTKELADILKNLKLNAKKVAIVPNGSKENLLRAGRNIKNTSIFRIADINSYEVLVNDKLLLEEKAVLKLEKRLGKSGLKTRKHKSGEKVA
jgi:large subunit ribosomal protein L4